MKTFAMLSTLFAALAACQTHAAGKQTSPKPARLGQLVADQAVPVAAIVRGDGATVSCDAAQVCRFYQDGKPIGQLIAEKAAQVAAIVAKKTAKVTCLSGITVTCDFRAD